MSQVIIKFSDMLGSGPTFAIDVSDMTRYDEEDEETVLSDEYIDHIRDKFLALSQDVRSMYVATSNASIDSESYVAQGLAAVVDQIKAIPSDLDWWFELGIFFNRWENANTHENVIGFALLQNGRRWEFVSSDLEDGYSEDDIMLGTADDLEKLKADVLADFVNDYGDDETQHPPVVYIRMFGKWYALDANMIDDWT